MSKPSTPKGMRDFLPVEMAGRNHIFNTIKSTFQLFGYQPIETPAMELLSTLTGKYGDEGDKLLYKVLNSGDFLSSAIEAKANINDSRTLSKFISEKGLKYDLTVPFARFVVEHYNNLIFPFKRYQIQPVWRADRPQKGRYREFYQCDADVIGSDSLLYEYELLELTASVFRKLGIDIIIKINNRKILSGIAEIIGYSDKFTDITIAIDKLDKTSIESVSEDLLKVGLDHKSIGFIIKILSFQETDNLKKLEFIETNISGSETGLKGISELKEVLKYCAHSGQTIPVETDMTLARGLNYYTGTIIEVKANNVEIGSICGGGRYDDLTGVFGMPGMSGVGISFGADRIYDVMKMLNLFPEQITASSVVMIVNFGDEEILQLMPFANKLRQNGISTEIYPANAKLKKQFSYASDKNIEFVIVAGKDELSSGKYGLKNMRTSEQKSMSPIEIIDFIKTKISE